jgi:Skp family chaperone for outer membrane proteins
MKRFGLGFLLAIGVVVLGGVGWAGELKIATVDADRLLKGYHKTDLMDAHLEDQAKDFNNEGEKMLAQHRRMKKEFESLRSEARNSALSEEARDKRLQVAEDKLLEVMEYESQIRETAVSRRQQLDDERRQMRQKLIDEIRDEIREFARKSGYTLVLDSSSGAGGGFPPALYSDGTLDITADIEKSLNRDKSPAKE